MLQAHSFQARLVPFSTFFDLLHSLLGLLGVSTFERAVLFFFFFQTPPLAVFVKL